MKCLILAGGFATRLYPLTLNKAKALLEYRGKPVITHIVNKVPRSFDILVTANRKFEADFLRWGETLSRPVEICVEEALSNEQKIGAVGSIDFWIKRKDIREDILLVAADNYFEFDLADFIAEYNRENVIVAVYDVGDKEKACEISKACQVGLVTVEEGRIVRFDEKPRIATSSIIATGIYVLPARLFALIAQYCRERKQDNMGSFITYLLSQDKVVHAYTITSIWLDVGDEILKGKVSI